MLAYVLQVAFLSGRLMTSYATGAECEAAATRVASVHGSDFVEASCEGPDQALSIKRAK